MTRIAHISDVHLPLKSTVHWTQLMNKRLTGYLNWKLNRSRAIGQDYLQALLDHMSNQNPDHIAVTGDLVNLALPVEIDEARGFLQGLGKPEDVSIVCGNHDAYVPGALGKALSSWKSYAGSHETPILAPGDFPYLRIIDKVALIGCNSAQATLPFMATGFFRKRQQSALARLLDRSKQMCRIVMIHHPPVHGATPFHKRLVGAKRFQQVVAKHGAELILHGHTHLADEHIIQGPASPVPVIGVPAAGNSAGNSKPPGRYNLFEVKGKTGGWSINWQSYGISEEGRTIERIENRHLYRDMSANHSTRG